MLEFSLPARRIQGILHYLKEFYRSLPCDSLPFCQSSNDGKYIFVAQVPSSSCRAIKRFVQALTKLILMKTNLSCKFYLSISFAIVIILSLIVGSHFDPKLFYIAHTSPLTARQITRSCTTNHAFSQ